MLQWTGGREGHVKYNNEDGETRSNEETIVLKPDGNGSYQLSETYWLDTSLEVSFPRRSTPPNEEHR